MTIDSIIKAINCCYNNLSCVDCPLYEEDNNCQEILTELTIEQLTQIKTLKK